MNALEYLKIVGSHVVLTAFRDRHNQLVDRVIYDVKIVEDEDGKTHLDFYLNGKIESLMIPTQLVSLTDVSVSDLLNGQTLLYNTVLKKWVNSTPSLSSLSDVNLKATIVAKDVLFYDGTKWVNGLADNTDYSSTAFLNNGDSYNKALSSLDDVLRLLAPAKPDNLSNKTLTISGSYSAIQTSSNITRFNVTNNLKPTISFVGGAFNGASGNLSAKLFIGGDSTPKVTPDILFTTTSDTGKNASDTGLNIKLNITDDYDFHQGVAGKSGFWIAFAANVEVIKNLTVTPEEHKVSMTHTETGSAELTFYTDDAVTPTISNTSVSTAAAGTRTISGVPTLSNNDLVDISFKVENAIRNFYRESIASVSSLVTNPHTFKISLTTNKNHGDVFTAATALSINNNIHNEDVSFTFSGFNSRGISASSTAKVINKTLRVDTISNEAGRLTSGTGSLPTTGYGTAFNSTQSLLLNEELQLVGGKYQYPSGNYTTNYPVAGPNYSTITSGLRYVTFSVNITEASTIRIIFNGSENFDQHMNVNKTMNNNFSLQIRINGSKPTSGWLDGNKPYAGGNPMNNGDGALILASANTTATSKDIAFGTSNKTGMCYVRIGLNYHTANRMKFSDITIIAA
jgi:hypothetical protein